MYIRRIQIENVRGFGEGDQAVDLDLTRPDGTFAGWTVLAGPNGSGKTTVLQAVAAVLLGGELQTYGITPMMTDFDLDAGPDADNYLTLVRVHLQDAGDLPEVCSDPHDRDEYSGKEPLSRVTFWPPRLSTISTPGHCLAAYGAFRRLQGHSQSAWKAMTAADAFSRVVTLFREDASLAHAVEWLRGVNYRKLEKRPGAASLEKAALGLLQDDLLPEVEVERVDSDGLWVRRNGDRLPLASLSDGYQNTVGLVLDIVHSLYETFDSLETEQRDGRVVITNDGVVLIDEVDAHLHPSWQRQIGFWMKEHFPNIQFIVTTHSPFICQAADPGGLIRLGGPGERPAERVDEDVYRKVVNGTLDSAIVSELFGLDTAFSPSAKRLRQRVAQLQVQLQTEGLSDDERNELLRLREELPQTTVSEVQQALFELAQEP